MTEPYIHNHSALLLTGAFVAFLRERFSIKNATPWVAFDDLNNPGQVLTGRDGLPYEAIPLYIITEFDSSTETDNLYPRIVVTAGQDIGGRHEVIGDLGVADFTPFRTGERTKWGTSELDIEFHVYGEELGEARYISEIAGNAVRMTQQSITEKFTLRDLTPVVVQAPRPDAMGKWMGAVSMRLFKEDRWFTIPDASRLQRLATVIDMDNVVAQTNASLREVGRVSVGFPRSAPDDPSSGGGVYPPSSAAAAAVDTLDLVAAVDIGAGRLVAVDVAGKAALASNLDGDNLWRIVGVAIDAALPGQTTRVHTMFSAVPVTFQAAPALGTAGSYVYADTDGFATLTAPSDPGTVVVRVGVLLDPDGAETSPRVLFQPLVPLT